jgi:hypothetical protein
MRKPGAFDQPAIRFGEGALDLRTMYLATVAWLISMPSLRSSPWIRSLFRSVGNSLK